jgi:CheY-like chemotaxis protein
MRRVLLVDDNRAFADNLAEILEDDGCDVTQTDDPVRALSVARGRSFDVVITDMRMPSMNGATLVRELHLVDPGLPAIVLTAYSREAELASARDQGLLAVLPKPAPIAQLLALVSGARRGEDGP